MYPGPKMLCLTALLWSCANSAESGTISPDFYIGMECTNISVQQLESDFERFLVNNYFRLVNRSEYVRKNGKSTPYSTQIAGLKPDQMIVFEKAGYFDSKYHVRINTRPDKNQDIFLHNKTQEFIKSLEYCKILEQRSSSRNINSQEAFNAIYRIYENWLKQSE